MIPKLPTGQPHPLSHVAVASANADLARADANAIAVAVAGTVQADDVKPGVEQWLASASPSSLTQAARALARAPDPGAVGALFREVAARAAAGRAAGEGAFEGNGWRLVPSTLNVIAGARSAGLLAIAEQNGHTFRPTLAGRMDSAPEKVRRVTAFLAALCEAEGAAACIVGSSTTAPGSPDWIMNHVAGVHGVPMLRVNNKAYFVDENGTVAEGAQADHLKDPAAHAAFTAATHFSFATPDDYAEALATVANVAILTGGRADSLRELKNAVTRGNPVILADVPQHRDSGHAWDGGRVVGGKPAPRTDDAAAYLRHQIACAKGGRPQDMFPDFGGITAQWILENRAALDRLILDVALHDDASIATATAAAVAHVHAVNAAS